MHIGNGDAVVGHGDVLRYSTFAAALYFAFVEHAAAAMHYKLILGQVLWELRATAEAEFRLRFGKAANPAGKLYCADVLTLAVVRAALADEYLIAILHCIEYTHCLHCRAERALVARHEDGEGG